MFRKTSVQVIVLSFTVLGFVYIAFWNLEEGDLRKYNAFSVPVRENKNMGYFRVDTTPEKTGKLPFLDNYKNPCWRELMGDGKTTRIRCLPYYHTVGFPKCGTTGLDTRMRRYSLISRLHNKENNWLGRHRFRTGHSGNLSEYLGYFDKAVEKVITTKNRNGFFNSIIGDASTATAWDHKGFLNKENNSNMSQPPYTNADVIYNLYPKTKIIFILRNPVKRLYSDYLYAHRRQKLNYSTEDFHYKVIRSINNYRECLKTYSSMHCVYFNFSALPINIGFYHIYIQNFMNVFPRDQILVLKLESYIKSVSRHMTDIFSFLDIEMPTKQKMLAINRPIVSYNSNTRSYNKAGPMMEETYQLIYELYKPYNDQLVKLMGSKFDYN